MVQDTLVQAFIDRLKFSDFRASVTFDMGDDGVVAVDASQRPASVVDAGDETDLLVMAARDLLQGFLDGSKDPNMAFMMGKLKIKGPMGLAMKLNAVFDD